MTDRGPRLRLDRTGRVAAAIAVVLALTAGTAIGYALVHQRDAPEPPAAGRATTTTSAKPTTEPGRERATGARPVRLRIPAIGVTSRVQALGLNADNTIETPPTGPRYDQAAWYKYSTPPGRPGTSIVQGHVDSADGGPSVFFRLGDLRPGDRVVVTLRDRSRATFVVSAVRRYAKDDFPTLAVYQHTEHASLRLVTCGGAFDRATGHYRDNVIAFARRVAVTGP